MDKVKLIYKALTAVNYELSHLRREVDKLNKNADVDSYRTNSEHIGALDTLLELLSEEVRGLE